MANSTAMYTREREGHVERLTVMSYIGGENGDGDEIRVIRAVDDHVVDDQIAWHDNNGLQWLRERHTEWIADGYTQSIH